MIDSQLNPLFRNISIVVFLALLIPNMFQEGLFMDGLIYSTTGYNLSRDFGTFWAPAFTATFIDKFVGHPPLAIYLHSLFFKAFGNFMFVDKLFPFVAAILTGGFLILIWRHFYKNDGRLFLSWFALLLWITIPLCHWVYQNNLLEASMAVFTMAACYLFILSSDKRGISAYLLIFAASFCVILGFLTKGFPALFPIAIPAIHWLVFRKGTFIMALLSSFAAVASLLLLFTLIFYKVEARSFLEEYISVQVIGSISGGAFNDPRYYIILRLLEEFIAPIALLLILGALVKYKLKRNVLADLKEEQVLMPFLFFFLVALSASLPIMLSPKQKSFYLMPSLPFFALAITCVFAPMLKGLLANRWKPQPLKKLSFMLLGLVPLVFLAAFLMSGHPSRDRNLINDVKSLKEVVPQGAVIGAEPGFFYQYSLIGYLHRYHQVSIAQGDYQFKLADKKTGGLENFELLLETNNFFLLRKKCPEGHISSE
jgi:4-amino-4-deoxy-L-arabinose transferase-like glycosyltransferase